MHRRPVDNRLLADAWSDPLIMLPEVLPEREGLLALGDMTESRTCVKTVPSRMISVNDVVVVVVVVVVEDDDDVLRP
jgi:hypothetical protein